MILIKKRSSHHIYEPSAQKLSHSNWSQEICADCRYFAQFHMHVACYVGKGSWSPNRHCEKFRRTSSLLDVVRAVCLPLQLQLYVVRYQMRSIRTQSMSVIPSKSDAIYFRMSAALVKLQRAVYFRIYTPFSPPSLLFVFCLKFF